MILTNSSWLGLAPFETIACFGVAQLVRKLDGHYELIGGTPTEHSAAREWCSLFAHEVVFTSTPRQNPAFALPNKFSVQCALFFCILRRHLSAMFHED